MHELEGNGPDEPSPEPTRAANDERQHHVCTAVKLEDIERRKARGLRQERTCRRSQRAAQRVHRRQPPVDRHADGRQAQPVVTQRLQRHPQR